MSRLITMRFTSPERDHGIRYKACRYSINIKLAHEQHGYLFTGIKGHYVCFISECRTLLVTQVLGDATLVRSPMGEEFSASVWDRANLALWRIWLTINF